MSKISVNNMDANKIIDEMFENGLIDDHDNGRTIYHPTVALLKVNANADVIVCAAFDIGETAYFSVNPVYLDDNGKAHLSVGSVGGVVDLRRVTTFEEAIANYNSSQLIEGFSKHVLMPVRKTAA